VHSRHEICPAAD